MLVPLTHRLGRAKTGKTVHFQLTPLDQGQVHPNVRLLENFLLFEVPADQAERVTGSVDGTDVRGHTLRLELANA